MCPLAVTFVVAAGCCPPPEPQYATCTAAPPKQQAQPQPPRNLPAPVLGRFQEPRGRTEPVSEMITEPPRGLPGPKVDEVPVTREPHAPPRSAQSFDTLPDEIVMRLLETHRAAFVRCFKKQVQADPTELSFKVRVHVEIDEQAKIMRVTTNAGSSTLDACLQRAVAWIKFPAGGRPVAVDLPLIFRAN
jgi:hypothetical protein